MKKRYRVFIVLGICICMMLGSVMASNSWSDAQLAAFEARWGSDWMRALEDPAVAAEFGRFVNYNNARNRANQEAHYNGEFDAWNNPQDPPPGWKLGDPLDGSGSTTTTTSKPKCEHEYEMQVTSEPTCVEEGIVTYTCTKCGNKYTQALEPTGTHEYVSEVTKEPTCTEEGETTYTCSMCGDSYAEEIAKLEHEYTSETTKKVTCTEEGETTYTCSICGDTYTEPIPARGHSEGSFEVTTPNGWFTEGEQVQKCVSCGEILVTEVIPSMLPIWYLYVAIGFAVVLVGTIIGIVIWVKKKR